MRRFNIGYYIKEGVRSIFTHGFMSFAAVCMIIACLLIMGSFSLVAVDLDHNLSILQDQNEFHIFIDENLSEDEARALQSTIEAIPNVSSAQFASREQVRDEFLAAQDNTLFTTAPDSVYRHRYSIRVVDIERMQETVQRVADLPQVGNYNAATEVADGLVAARNVAGAISIVLIAVLFLISLFIIFNTIQLATFSRRDEVAIIKMCGATNAFVRWPFVFEGMILGLFGAVVAFFLQWGVYNLIIDAVSGLAFIDMVSFGAMAVRVLLIFAGAGFVIGVGGSLLAIRKFLQV